MARALIVGSGDPDAGTPGLNITIVGLPEPRDTEEHDQLVRRLERCFGVILVDSEVVCVLYPEGQ